MEFAVQAETFAILTAVGVLLGLLFDFYRVLRGIYKPRRVVTAAGDLVYWLFATVITGGALLYSNWGEMRLYVVLALLAGAGGYFKFFSRTSLRLMIFCMRWLATLIKWLASVVRWFKIAFVCILVKPIVYPFRLMAYPFRYSYRKLRDWCSRFDNVDGKPPT